MLKMQFTLMQDVAVQRSQKMLRVIRDNQPLNCVEEEEWEMAAWKTPDIPRGFFNTTSRTVYSTEENVEGEDEDRIHNGKRDEEEMIWYTWGSMRSKTAMMMTMKSNP